MVRKKHTAHYRSLDGRRTALIQTGDPVFRRSVLQSRLRVQLQLIGYYEGRQVAAFHERYARLAVLDEGGATVLWYNTGPEMEAYLGGLPLVLWDGTSRRRYQRTRATYDAHSHVAVPEILLRDVPDRCSMSALARLIQVGESTLLRWRADGLPTLGLAHNRVWFSREVLRTWLLERGLLRV